MARHQGSLEGHLGARPRRPRPRVPRVGAVMEDRQKKLLLLLFWLLLFLILIGKGGVIPWSITSGRALPLARNALGKLRSSRWRSEPMRRWRSSRSARGAGYLRMRRR